MRRFVVAICLISILALLASCVAAADGDPKFVRSYLLHPNGLALVLRAGKINPAARGVYSAEGGDVIGALGMDYAIFRQPGPYVYGTYLNSTLNPTAEFHSDWATLDGSMINSSLGLNQTSNYNIASSVDPAYLTAQEPVLVATQRIVDNTDRSEWAGTPPWWYENIYEEEWSVFLSMPAPIKLDTVYHLNASIESIGDISQDFEIRSNDPNAISEAIHVNQFGLSPFEKKTALLSFWAGSYGKVNFTDALPTLLGSVVSESNEQVMLSNLVPTLRKSWDDDSESYYGNLAGTDIYEYDFSPLSEEGCFYFVVAGMGRSRSFNVTKGHYWDLSKLLLKRFYYQRDGIPLEEPYVDSIHVRPPVHTFDRNTFWISNLTLAETSEGDIDHAGMPKPWTLWNTHDTGVQLNHEGKSWMDAGDWDERIISTFAMRQLIELFMFDPSRFEHMYLNIPESTNDIPDILDEVRYAISFYLETQKPDGSVYAGLETTEHPNWLGLSFDPVTWQKKFYAYQGSAWAAFQYAATAARLSFAMKKYNESDANLLRLSAERAFNWAWARTDPSFRPSNHSVAGFNNKYDVAMRDYSNLAAIELYRLTKNFTYHEVFEDSTFYDVYRAATSVWDGSNDYWLYYQREAAFVYLSMQKIGGYSLNASILLNVEVAVITEADARLVDLGRSGFRFVNQYFHPPNQLIVPDVYTLVWAHNITGNESYFDAILDSLSLLVGRNPSNLVYITAVEDLLPSPTMNVVKHPLIVDTISRGLPPYPGTMVSGPADRASSDTGGAAACDNLYPDCKTWPTLQLYTDVGLMNPLATEFTPQATMSPAAIALGYVTGRTGSNIVPDRDCFPPCGGSEKCENLVCMTPSTSSSPSSSASSSSSSSSTASQTTMSGVARLNLKFAIGFLCLLLMCRVA